MTPNEDYDEYQEMETPRSDDESDDESDGEPESGAFDADPPPRKQTQWWMIVSAGVLLSSAERHGLAMEVLLAG